MAYSTLTVMRDGDALKVTLNRPDVLNALSLEMLTELTEALDAAAQDEGVRAIMITGAGRGFCSGADLAATELGDGLGAIVARYYNPLIRSIVDMPKPVIAAVNGVAAGAGMSLALACDMRLLSKSASFALGFTKIGLVMDASCSYFLPRLVGLGRAFELGLSGRKVDAGEAAGLGLGELVLDAETFDEEAWRYVTGVAAGPTAAFGLLKAELRASLRQGLSEQLDLEAQLQQRASETEDFQEGVAAFTQKRPARFKGR